eukprot:370743-Pelagomonas_calceolata.AAC.1
MAMRSHIRATECLRLVINDARQLRRLGCKSWLYKSMNKLLAGRTCFFLAVVKSAACVAAR